MTETHKIRSPEWSHIHERDNQIIERDNRILELEAANATLRRQLEAAECGGVAWNTIVDNLTDFDLELVAEMSRNLKELEAANATLRRQLEEEKEQTSELRAFLEARELARLFASRTREQT